MSLLPTVWPAVDYRGDRVCRIPPRVIIKGDPKAVEQMMEVFKHEYFSIVRSMASGVAPQQVIEKRFDNGARMRVVSNQQQDIVYLYAEGGVEALPLSAFLVTMSDEKQRLYFFDFDSTDFDYIEVEGLSAGISRVKVKDVFLSWDGTGGGDLAHETPPKSLPISNYEPKPFDHLSGSLYVGGKTYPFVEGAIYGVGVNGRQLIVATASTGKIVFHAGVITYDATESVIESLDYAEAIGFATLDNSDGTLDTANVVNFNSDLTKCVCGRRIITIPEDNRSPTTAFRVTLIVFAANEFVRSAGFTPSATEGAPEVLRFTTMRETLKVVGGYVAPTNTFEYSNGVSGWNDSPDSHVSHQTVDVTYEYFDLEYVENWTHPQAADRTGKVHKDMLATVIKKPIIIFQGIYPTTAYTWMRTITQEETQAENIFYWYRDYLNDEFVRCNWSRGYFKTAQYDEYGAFDPVASDVLNSYAINVNKQKVFMNGLWFYTVANGEGDFILRKQPNNKVSDMLLVSKTGKTKTVTGTKAIAIF